MTRHVSRRLNDRGRPMAMERAGRMVDDGGGAMIIIMRIRFRCVRFKSYDIYCDDALLCCSGVIALT